jgi:hypothetical protein
MAKRECGRNAKEAARVYVQCFPNRNHPDHKTILSTCYRTNSRNRSNFTKQKGDWWCSQDCTHCLERRGYFRFWGHVKNIIRSPIALDLEEQLRGRVREAFAIITPEMITNSKLSLLPADTVMLANEWWPL